nr:secretin and TonB N-terminal domain-containing protein [Methylogaea oryzae]
MRQVLQILADFTGLNMVASDTVQGNVTLRLNDVPWDQALDIVLKSKGLAKRQDGGVVRIGPAAEVQKQEQDELAANQKVEELAPLITELIYVKYAKAADMLAILQGGVAARIRRKTRNRPRRAVPKPIPAGRRRAKAYSRREGRWPWTTAPTPCWSRIRR